MKQWNHDLYCWMFEYGKNCFYACTCLHERWDHRWDNIKNDKAQVGKSIAGLLSKEWLCVCVEYKYIVMLIALCWKILAPRLIRLG